MNTAILAIFSASKIALATVGYAVYNATTGAIVTARTTAGVANVASSVYRAVADIPTDGAYEVRWDTGEGTPEYASEILDLRPAATIAANLDATVSSRNAGPVALTAAYDAAKTAASQASVNAIPTNPVLVTDARLIDIASIKAKTDNLPADPAAASDVAVTVTPTLTAEQANQLAAIAAKTPDHKPTVDAQGRVAATVNVTIDPDEGVSIQ